MKNRIFKFQAQSTVEYMILLAAVMAVVLIGLKTYLPRTGAASNLYFNRVTNALLDKPNACGDGCCRTWELPYCNIDCSAGLGCH